jgi:hypothetical protein
VLHAHGKGRQKTSEVRLDNSFRWQTNMFRSLEASYRSSPFFEYYEDDIRAVFEKRYDYLLDLNLATVEVVNACLDIELSFDFTGAYQQKVEASDMRFLVDAKSKVEYDFKPYTQVFGGKHGFLSNMSILDLLFNEGTNALNYLQDHVSLLKL